MLTNLNETLTPEQVNRAVAMLDTMTDSGDLYSGQTACMGLLQAKLVGKICSYVAIHCDSTRAAAGTGLTIGFALGRLFEASEAMEREFAAPLQEPETATPAMVPVQAFEMVLEVRCYNAPALKVHQVAGLFDQDLDEIPGFPGSTVKMRPLSGAKRGPK